MSRLRRRQDRKGADGAEHRDLQVQEGRAVGGRRRGRDEKALADLRDAVETNCDYVGDQFAEEARKIHYEETDKRNIYGEASETEAEALKEEGVEFNRIPWLPRTNS